MVEGGDKGDRRFRGGVRTGESAPTGDLPRNEGLPAQGKGTRPRLQRKVVAGEPGVSRLSGGGVEEREGQGLTDSGGVGGSPLTSPRHRFVPKT